MYTVAVMTGTRADYGLLRPVMQKLADSRVVSPRLLVSGAHLSAAYGMTVSEVEADGFEISARLDILSQPAPAGRPGTAQRAALAVRLFLDVLQENAGRPDLLLLLGDRYEAFAAGQAAVLLGIPLAHISGGDVTAGADDDWFRHCLTKMAKLHFVSCEVYRQRVIRMGEAPDRVFNVGGLGDENIRRMRLLSKKTLAGGLGLNLDRPYALATLHPETISDIPAREQAGILLRAAERRPRLFYLFTGANADAGGEEINAEIAAFCGRNENAAQISSLGTLRYLSAMKYAALVLGNSSSGVVESPSLGVPAVDIGGRQAGRVTGDNVIHCAMRADAIVRAIDEALTPAFAAGARAAGSPYNGGDTSGRIAAHIGEALESGVLGRPKVFYDGEGDR